MFLTTGLRTYSGYQRLHRLIIQITRKWCFISEENTHDDGNSSGDALSILLGRTGRTES